MFNTFMLWKLDLKNPGIPGQAIYHHAMDKYIEYRYNVEKDDLLVLTPNVINTNIYQFYNNWTESNDISRHVEF